ncbi:hypothetical protein DENSPDRAFT_887042, partial [Dentipellis sp. KUC8613]
DALWHPAAVLRPRVAATPPQRAPSRGSWPHAALAGLRAATTRPDGAFSRLVPPRAFATHVARAIVPVSCPCRAPTLPTPSRAVARPRRAPFRDGAVSHSVVPYDAVPQHLDPLATLSPRAAPPLRALAPHGAASPPSRALPYPVAAPSSPPRLLDPHGAICCFVAPSRTHGAASPLLPIQPSCATSQPLEHCGTVCCAVVDSRVMWRCLVASHRRHPPWLATAPRTAATRPSGRPLVARVRTPSRCNHGSVSRPPARPLAAAPRPNVAAMCAHAALTSLNRARARPLTHTTCPRPASLVPRPRHPRSPRPPSPTISRRLAPLVHGPHSLPSSLPTLTRTLPLPAPPPHHRAAAARPFRACAPPSRTPSAPSRAPSHVAAVPSLYRQGPSLAAVCCAASLPSRACRLGCRHTPSRVPCRHHDIVARHRRHSAPLRHRDMLSCRCPRAPAAPSCGPRLHAALAHHPEPPRSPWRAPSCRPLKPVVLQSYLLTRRRVLVPPLRVVVMCPYARRHAAWLARTPQQALAVL